jgi:propanediol dehydratase small subunit
MTPQTPESSRPPQEVFAHHGKALADGNLDEIHDGMIRAQTVRYTPHPKG